MINNNKIYQSKYQHCSVILRVYTTVLHGNNLIFIVYKINWKLFCPNIVRVHILIAIYYRNVKREAIYASNATDAKWSGRCYIYASVVVEPS